MRGGGRMMLLPDTWTAELVAFSYEIEVFKRDARQSYIFGGYLNPVDRRCVGENGSDEREVDCKGRWTRTLLGSLFTKFDQAFTG
jgi:hypothetical protein